MRVMVRVLATFLAAVWLPGIGTHPAVAAAEICPMGGVMIKAQTDKEKTLAWGASPRRSTFGEAGTDWSLYARSGADQGIGVMIAPGYIFFGVAGRGGETYPRNIEEAFGKDLGKLRDAVRKELNGLTQAGVVQIDTADIQTIADALGLGILEKDGKNWSLKTRRCQAVSLPVSGL